MKPAFALSFSSAGISLHHFADDEWFCVGEVSLGAEDLNTQIEDLRNKGFALENDLSCRLILPTDQVRFLSVETDASDPAGTDQRVRTALSEATPYELDELAFDTVNSDTTTYIAAVAKQTLKEAQAFAADHGFIPVEFTTQVDDQDYPADPLFSLADQSIAQPTAPIAPEEPDGPAVHAIAASSTPAEFRSAPAQTTAGQGPASGMKLPQGLAMPLAAAAVIAVVLIGWGVFGSDGDAPLDTELADVQKEPAEPAPLPLQTESLDAEDSETASVTPPEPEAPLADEDLGSEISPTDAAILEALNETPTDAAILEALKIAPTVVEDVAKDPEPEPVQAHAGARIVVPTQLLDPEPAVPETVYLTSIDKSDLSRDAIALPEVGSFDTDTPFEQVANPTKPGTRFDLDDRGLVAATVDGTLNPDGIVVYLGRPAKVPPDVPVRFEQEPVVEELTSRLAELRPKPRPSDLIERFERQQLGGRTREELASVRPKLRPKSVQERPQVDHTPTALAVVRVPRPKPRPAGLIQKPETNTARLGSAAAIPQNNDEAGSFQARAVAPKIPSSASVARQATIDNAINLRKLNLIGVYGSPANRRALVRLPSGRYKKLKVGDRLDGGNVVAISDSELRYQKRGQNVTLRMPRS
ncbi:hypothetical protein RUESEDTHA_00161 [Ruegeria sp. THAF57]|uniref:hypothetical protein n=1 Tax=Ruegeria sp. THAF57 TaxID=2744555 RepID=UPI0015DE1FDA|nr:hypothetical protein [Ruegeria sp. THAF57]CAD0183297.1 hypothetical protein RUESEDTHA_00161 [Ruegeria sp. THAF57]